MCLNVLPHAHVYAYSVQSMYSIIMNNNEALLNKIKMSYPCPQLEKVTSV